jgi:ABC-type uncharacterized transport system involved in gliding motility auxiliary subunit
MKSHLRRDIGLLLASLAVMFLGLSISLLNWKVSFLSLTILFIGLCGLLACLLIKTGYSFGLLTQRIELIFKISVLLGAVIVLNIFVVQRNVYFDVTKLKQHSLNENTIKLLGSLKSPLKITALYAGLPPKYLEDLLKEYERRSNGKVQTEIIDPIVQIGYAAQFGNIISGKEQKAIITSGTDRRDIDFTERPLSEDQLDNAIIRVTRKTKNAYFLSGHEEYDLYGEKENGLSEFNKMLLANNIFAKKLLLTKGASIPSDCDLLVIAGAQHELTKDEEKLILDYLDRGGDALFLVENIILTTPDVSIKESDINRNPSLNNILEKWGVKVATDVVVDVASHAGGDVGSPATKNYLPHKAIVSGLDYTFYVRPRSIAMVKTGREKMKTVPLVLTASTQESWAETNRHLEIKYDSETDRPGPVPIAFIMWEPKEEASDQRTSADGKKLDNKPSDTRLALFTDADFISNAYVNQLSNAQMGLNTIKWLLEEDYQAFVPTKDVKVEALNLASPQKRMILFILMTLNFSVIVVGMFVWLMTQKESS